VNNSELEDAKAQYKQALQYIDGESVPRDFNEAAILLRKASAQGFADAQYLLGIMHEGGEGATQDIQQATSYMRKAAEQGHTEAQAWLAAQVEKFKAANSAPEPSAQTQTTVAKPRSKKRDYYWLLDIPPGFALGQLISKDVLRNFHGSPDASSWAVAISLMLGGAVGFVLCKYARTQFTKNMQSRSAVIFWSFAISFGLMLAIVTTTAVLEKSAAQPTSNEYVDAFAPGYVDPAPAQPAIASWTSLGEFGEVAIYIDFSSIQKSGSRVKMRDLFDFKTTQTNNAGANYLSWKFQREFDCNERQIRTLTGTGYSNNMGTGRIVTQSNSQAWAPITPSSDIETTQEILWKIACGKQ
jgi:hypothetical protein